MTTTYALHMTDKADPAVHAGSIGAILDQARTLAINQAGPDRVTITITTPDGTRYPFAYTIDPAEVGAEYAATLIDDMLWNVRATMHDDQDRAVAAETSGRCG